MNKISILMLALVLLVGGVAIAQDDMMKTGVTVSGKVELGSYFLGPEDSEYNQYDFDAELKFDAKVDEFNSAYIALVEKSMGDDYLVQVDEATLTSEIGGWSGLSALVPVTLTFKTGYYEPEAAEKGEVTAFGLEDVLGAGVGKDIGNFDVTIGILEVVNVKAGFNLGDALDEADVDNVADNPTNLFIGVDTSIDVGVGTVGAALYFGDSSDNGGLGQGEVGVGAQFDLTTIPGITIGVGVQFEYRLGASADLESDGSNPEAYGTAPIALGAGVSFKNTNTVPVTAGVGVLFETASGAQADDDGDNDGKLGVAIDLGVSDPSSTFGIDIGAVLAFGAPKGPLDADPSTFDLLDVSGWVKTGATTFRVGYVLIPADGGNLATDYNGPNLRDDSAAVPGESAGALYLTASLSF